MTCKLKQNSLKERVHSRDRTISTLTQETELVRKMKHRRTSKIFIGTLFHMLKCFYFLFSIIYSPKIVYWAFNNRMIIFWYFIFVFFLFVLLCVLFDFCCWLTVSYINIINVNCSHHPFHLLLPSSDCIKPVPFYLHVFLWCGPENLLEFSDWTIWEVAAWRRSNWWVSTSLKKMTLPLPTSINS